MVDGIGAGSSLAREALRAALESHAKSANEVRSLAADLDRASGTNASGPVEADFAGALDDQIRGIESEIRAAESLPHQIVTGEIRDFHEVAVQLKRADLSFRFAMEIRNKLIDAYREVMRMSV